MEHNDRTSTSKAANSNRDVRATDCQSTDLTKYLPEGITDWDEKLFNIMNKRKD